ncbi:SIS domain-containing protein [Kineococcus sp. SYSU DK006]|uniref:SIS domain-containing protein n=1 Tax=Kineococcus sp. SYSU DK006 TaxID=3383127 RepID=UPI003D7EC095
MTQHTWLSFEDGIAVQREGLETSIATVRDWLGSGAADHLRGRSLLLAGIGASHAAAATPAYALRENGIRAYRSSCADVPDAGADLADVYVGISQSGRSRETLQALLTVPRERRVAVVNHAGSPLEDQAGTVLSVGDLDDSRMSSIGFTATVAALGMLGDYLSRGAVGPGWDDLAATAEAAVREHDDVLRAFGARVAAAGTVDLAAAAPDLTAAEQGALLFREGPSLPSTAMDTRSYLHGPMDCAGSTTSHVLLGREREALLAGQLSEKGVPVLLVVDLDADEVEFGTTADTSAVSVVRLPALPPAQRVVVQVALLQQLVLHTARALGRDVEDRAFTRYDTKVDSVQQVLAGTP